MEFRPMSPEEVERTMQLLLHSQARFEANFARVSQKTEADVARLSEGLLGLTALHNQTERKVRDLADSVGTIRDGLNALTGIVGRMSEGVAQVVEAQHRQTQVGERIDRRLDRVAEVQQRQAEAGERLDHRLDQIAKMEDRRAKAGERLDRRLDRLEKSQERTDRQIKDLGVHFKRQPRRNHGRRS